MAKKKTDPGALAFEAGCDLVRTHPLMAPLWIQARVERSENGVCPDAGWACVSSNGTVHVHPRRRGEPEEWAWVLTHCLLHLGFQHASLQPSEGGVLHKLEWNLACCCAVVRFQTGLKLGRPPEAMRDQVESAATSEQAFYREFCQGKIPAWAMGQGTAGVRNRDLVAEPPRRWGTPPRWEDHLAAGLTAAVERAVQVAGGEVAELRSPEATGSRADRARRWFISSYPVLGALAASFRVIEDPALCARMEITVAAVDAGLGEIYVNPAAGLNLEEMRFVMAHELLHVGLRHAARRQGRDPFCWNVACDYVINDWLLEMQIGHIPQFGLLHDPALRGQSAESIYDQVVADLRRNRKLATLRGYGRGDMLDSSPWWERGEGLDLDDFYRRCLCQGLDYHQQGGRGLLPAGLLEEIRALEQPPIPWDVELARWFDHHFPPLERSRSYARPHRRQSATPDIPRPSWIAPPPDDGRTFGVVLDTSGSMDRQLLAKGLGAVASYSLAREVPRVRVVFCDAAAHDAGWLAPEAIVDRVRVRGRGGTVLQPGIDLLENAPDFPKDGPLLIITDGKCDHVRIRRGHAYLIPAGCQLPFPPRGPVFRMR